MIVSLNLFLSHSSLPNEKVDGEKEEMELDGARLSLHRFKLCIRLLGIIDFRLSYIGKLFLTPV